MDFLRNYKRPEFGTTKGKNSEFFCGEHVVQALPIYIMKMHHLHNPHVWINSKAEPMKLAFTCEMVASSDDDSLATPETSHLMSLKDITMFNYWTALQSTNVAMPDISGPPVLHLASSGLEEGEY